MKFTLALLFVITTSISFGQGYTDTLSYKTGMIRAGQIIKVTNTTIKYKYMGETGKEMTTMVRFSLLSWYTMDGVRDNMEPDTWYRKRDIDYSLL